MANLTFADSHNMVAYLEKSAENVDFAEIVDFINANLIRYALTMRLSIKRGETEWKRDTTIASSLEAKQDSGCSSFRNYSPKEESQEVGKEEKVKNSITQEEYYLTAAEPVTTVSTPVTIVGVSVSTAEPSTRSTTTTNLIEDEDLISAQTLMKMRSVKLKEKSKEKEVSSTRLTRGVIIKEASKTASRQMVPPQQQLDPKDKGKGIMQEPEKPEKVKGKDQTLLDEEVARRLEAQMQAEFKEEERVARQREEEANLISWDNTQAIMEADYELAQRLQAENRDKVLEGSGKKAKSSGKEAVSKNRIEEEFDQEKKGIYIYILVEKEYLLSRGTLTLMLVAKLLVDLDNAMSRELLRKIFMQAKRLRR
nr:hypothetical protein [Tanacetum cinerariifolium]